MLLVNKAGISYVPDSAQLPNAFIGYKLFQKLMALESAREIFLSELGVVEALVEIVKSVDNSYVVSSVGDVEIPNTYELEGVGFYEKI